MTGKILIIDDVATNRIVLKVKLSAACYQIAQAVTGAEALAQARANRPDLILLDRQLRDPDGLALCRKFKADPALRDIPVLMLSAFRAGDDRLAALRAGAADLLMRPLDDNLLLARMRSLMRMREFEAELEPANAPADLGLAEACDPFDPPGSIVMVAERRDTALGWKRDLTGLLSDRLMVKTRDEALADAADPQALTPELYLLASDLSQPGEGLRLMSELRSRTASRHAAVCIVMADQTPDTAAMALDLGAADVFAASTEPAEIALRLQVQMRRKRREDRLREQVVDGLRAAVIDPLTGLYNRRYALPHLDRIALRARRMARPFALMVLDLDRFKRVNDRWGHATGDAVLVEVAERLRANLRAMDLVARLGGEEFLVVMPDTGLAEAQRTAEQLRQVMEDSPVYPGAGLPAVPITVSIGLAIGPGADPDPAWLLGEADLALMRSKAEGRNTITVSRPAA